ncbi:MAG: hypothetical protein CSA74_06150 [Rhodobacterales bacterium]|nr:MAG: hypothetical protein CSA74_06150 [Rhodobacterales bacterium]
MSSRPDTCPDIGDRFGAPWLQGADPESTTATGARSPETGMPGLVLKQQGWVMLWIIVEARAVFNRALNPAFAIGLALRNMCFRNVP